MFGQGRAAGARVRGQHAEVTVPGETLLQRRGNGGLGRLEGGVMILDEGDLVPSESEFIRDRFEEPPCLDQGSAGKSLPSADSRRRVARTIQSTTLWGPLTWSP